jgi:hypothetical protein
LSSSGRISDSIAARTRSAEAASSPASHIASAKPCAEVAAIPTLATFGSPANGAWALDHADSARLDPVEFRVAASGRHRRAD